MHRLKNSGNRISRSIHINTRSKWFNLLLIGLCFVFLLAVRLYVNQPLGGDEPIYILSDYSLAHDHDLNLKNNYQHQDWLHFMPWLSPVPQGNPKIINLDAAKVYSPHGNGLPLFLLPGFYINSASGAIFEMVMLATLVIYLTWVWTKQVTKSRKLAYMASFLLLICYFFNGLAGFIYPDMFIAAATLISLIILMGYYKKLGFQILLSLVLGFLILVHIRTLDIVGPVMLILSYRLWKSERKLPWLSAFIVLAFVVYYFLTLHQWFGVWSYSATWSPEAVSFSVKPLTPISDLLFDSYRGLFIYNPILLLIFVGLPLWFKQHRESLIITLFTLVPSILVIISFKAFNGGDSPVGRYIIDFLPALIPAIALAINRLQAVWQKVVIAILAAITLFISIDNFMVKFPPVDLAIFQNKSTLFTQIHDHTGLAFTKVIPTYSNQLTMIGRYNSIKLVVCYLVVLGLLVYGYYLSKQVRASK